MVNIIIACAILAGGVLLLAESTHRKEEAYEHKKSGTLFLIFLILAIISYMLITTLPPNPHRIPEDQMTGNTKSDSGNYLMFHAMTMGL